MPDSRQASRGIPPWVWVGCGCVGALGTLVLIVAGLGFWGVQKVRDIGETMSDPVARNEQALKVLGADALPAGYHTVAALSIPFAFDYAILSDQPAGDDGQTSDLAQTGFIYMSFPAVGDGDEQLYDFFEGRSEDIESLEREHFNVALRERVARGRLPRGDDELLWVSHRGAVETDATEAAADGLVTMMFFECHDSRRRVGIWFGPDPSNESPDGSPDLASTVADETAIQSFTTPLNPCR